MKKAHVIKMVVKRSRKQTIYWQLSGKQAEARQRLEDAKNRYVQEAVEIISHAPRDCHQTMVHYAEEVRYQLYRDLLKHGSKSVAEIPAKKKATK